MLKPVKPVTHCWCQGALLPSCWGSGSCGGAPWIFREGGIPGFLVGQGAARPHRSQPKCLWELPGPPCPKAMENHLESLPEEDVLSFHSIPFLPLAVSWPSSSPRSRGRAGPGSRSGARCLPSALCLVLGTFCDLSGAEERFSHPHTGCLSCLCRWDGVNLPSWWNSAGAWDVMNAAL